MQEAEQDGVKISLLAIKAIPIDRPPVQTWWCSSLQTAKLQTKMIQSFRKTDRGILSHSSRGAFFIPNMNDPSEKSSGGQNDPLCRNLTSISQDHSSRLPVFDDKVDSLSLDDVEPRLTHRLVKHRLAIKRPVRLRAWPLNGGSLASIKKAKLDPREICNPPHHAIHCVDLTNQVTFPKSADRRVTGHHADTVHRQGDQGRRYTHACGSMGRLGARMPSTDYYHVIARMFHVKHASLSDAKATEDFVQQRFNINATDQ